MANISLFVNGLFHQILNPKDNLISVSFQGQYSNIRECLAKIGDHVNGVCGLSQILTQTWSRQVCQYIFPFRKNYLRVYWNIEIDLEIYFGKYTILSIQIYQLPGQIFGHIKFANIFFISEKRLWRYICFNENSE